MFSDVPNLSYSFGYTNASWTLKADLTAGYLCRMLNHMAKKDVDIALPRRDPGIDELPFIDFSSGYVQRALAVLPKQGSEKPWKLYQNYALDMASAQIRGRRPMARWTLPSSRADRAQGCAFAA